MATFSAAVFLVPPCGCVFSAPVVAAIGLLERLYLSASGTFEISVLVSVPQSYIDGKYLVKLACQLFLERDTRLSRHGNHILLGRLLLLVSAVHYFSLLVLYATNPNATEAQTYAGMVSIIIAIIPHSGTNTTNEAMI